MKQTATPASAPAPIAATVEFPRFKTFNWTHRDEVEVIASEAHGPGVDDVPRLVMLYVYAGSLTFQHSMSARQARQLAAQLMLCADAIDEPRVIPGARPEDIDRAIRSLAEEHGSIELFMIKAAGGEA